MSGRIETFASREAAADHVAALIEGALRQSLAARGEASLWLSGGSTPGPVFERLAQVDLDWDHVRTGLVDERWVAEDDPNSNAGLVGRSLLIGRASGADFVSMYREGNSLDEDADAADLDYRKLFECPPVLLLGMGNDGHTASWFPGVPALDMIMAGDGLRWVMPVDASNAPVAAGTPKRLTLTGAALNHSGMAILYITGEEKRAVLEERGADLPIHHAERLLGGRLKEVWAP